MMQSVDSLFRPLWTHQYRTALNQKSLEGDNQSVYLYIYRKNFLTVCLFVCLFPVGTLAISSQTAPSCDLKISPIVY